MKQRLLDSLLFVSLLPFMAAGWLCMGIVLVGCGIAAYPYWLVTGNRIL